MPSAKSGNAERLHGAPATIPSLYFFDDRAGANNRMRARNGAATVLSVVGEGGGCPNARDER